MPFYFFSFLSVSLQIRFSHIVLRLSYSFFLLSMFSIYSFISFLLLHISRPLSSSSDTLSVFPFLSFFSVTFSVLKYQGFHPFLLLSPFFLIHFSSCLSFHSRHLSAFPPFPLLSFTSLGFFHVHLFFVHLFLPFFALLHINLLALPFFHLPLIPLLVFPLSHRIFFFLIHYFFLCLPSAMLLPFFLHFSSPLFFTLIINPFC